MKAEIKILALIVMVLGIGVSSAFQKNNLIYTKYTDVKLPPLAAKELDRRINVFKKNLLKKCKENALYNAEVFVDKVISDQIKHLTNDTLAFPKEPIRPSLKKKIILDDSTAIKPILDN